MAYKILWYSIPSLLDTSSGAAIRCKLMLEKLHQRGIDVMVLNAANADDEQGMANINTIRRQLEPAVAINGNKCFYQFNLDGIEYFIHNTPHYDVDQLRAQDQTELFLLYAQMLEQYEPDLVMTYSADIFSSVMRSEARARGIPVVYALCNGSHTSFGFNDCDIVFTTSKATSDFYRVETDMDVAHVGNFIEPRQVVASPESRDPKYITMINPSHAKGIAVFIKLALTWNKKHPDQKFLIVKSRGNYEQILCSLHWPDGKPLVGPDGVNPVSMIDVAEHTSNISAVYALTRVLVAPSLWHESWGRVVTEANLNSIPVLATNNGGLYEAMGDGRGGICLPPPASSMEDQCCLPTDEEIAPYVEALEKLLTEDYTAACAEAAALTGIEASVDRLYNLIEPLLKQGTESKHPFDGSYYHNHVYMEKRRDSLKAAREAQAAAAASAAKGTATPGVVKVTGVRAQPKNGSRSSRNTKRKKR